MHQKFAFCPLCSVYDDDNDDEKLAILMWRLHLLIKHNLDNMQMQQQLNSGDYHNFLEKHFQLRFTL